MASLKGGRFNRWVSYRTSPYNRLQEAPAPAPPIRIERQQHHPSCHCDTAHIRRRAFHYLGPREGIHNQMGISSIEARRKHFRCFSVQRKAAMKRGGQRLTLSIEGKNSAPTH